MTHSSGQPTIWLLNGPLLLLYVAATALVVLLSEANTRVYSASSKDKPMPPAVIVVLTLASNLLCVASLVLLADALSSTTRLSMLLLPLLMLFERYVRTVRREPQKKNESAYALIGSVAGLLIGAGLFMSKAVTTEPFSRVTLPPDVATVPVAEVLRDGGNWAISLKLVLFYVVSMTIFVGLHSLIQMAARKLMACAPEKLKQRAAISSLIAFTLNFMGVVALVLIARSSDVQLRLAMVGFPLFLIAESYTRVLRSEPENRPSNWTGLIGSSSGMVLATFFLLRGAPLH